MNSKSDRKSDELYPRTAAEAVAERLRVQIQRGDPEPGTRLRQGEIARQFKVSTTPVREAFALLQADGLVRIDRHRGAIVFRPTMQDLQDSLEIREALETLAIKKAIGHLDNEALNDLQAVLVEMRQTDDDDRWMELNNRFHLAVYEPGGSPQLQALIANQRDASSWYIRTHIAKPKRRRQSDDEHQELLDACRAGDAERAEAAIRTHLQHSVEGIVKYLETDGRDDGAAAVAAPPAPVAARK